jgi:hypothetical protein
LDIIFPGKDLVEDIVSKDLVVFDDTTHLKLLDSKCNIDLLGLVVPCETVYFNLKDLLG